MEQNPYADHSPRLPQNLFEGHIIHPKKKGTERGELLQKFSDKTGKPIGYVAMRVKGFSLPDLYFIDSLCAGEEKRGVPYAKVWYGSIKTK